MSTDKEFIGNTPRGLEELRQWTSRRSEVPLAPEIPIIDAHHHLYDDERGRYLTPEIGAEIASGHNVVATVYLQHSAAYRTDGPEHLRPVGEVEFAASIARQTADGPIRLCQGIVGHANLALGDDVLPVLEASIQAGDSYFKGVRHGTTWDAGRAGAGRTFGPRHLLSSPDFRQGFAQLSKLNLSFDAWIFHPQLPELADLLRTFPDTPVVLNHCGGILGVAPHTDRSAVFDIWRKHIRTLAQFPNLSVKLGGLGMLYGGWRFHHEADPPDSQTLAKAWQPYIETCVEAFGPSRAMFESNFPVDKQSCGYGALWNAFKRITQSYSDSERSALFHGTASNFYRLSAVQR
ncbi:amidohydrolase [Candidimonas sp. SYP-B2681]|uniref:amidohydrolase family protein n=1 Tax=Candidimonas sp. SYP-B2681 TaxID=2497686 RepID=UPI000F86AC0B|nr:amidohydrolase family protein [Candidimonas sp. SYP-B2681]RTZ45470.1 amidohydrolase [Candidimonas sp. SYP-B2681]